MKPLLGIGRRYDVAIRSDRYEVFKRIIVIGYKDSFRVLCFKTRTTSKVFEVSVDSVYVIQN